MSIYSRAPQVLKCVVKNQIKPLSFYVCSLYKTGFKRSIAIPVTGRGGL
jgi:hypothetical protein